MFEIGPALREARVRRHLTLQQVEEDTKIRVKYLQAMEAEEFHLMPGSAYVKGFLRSYAAYLGLDAQLFVDEYNSRYGEKVESLSESPNALKGPPRIRKASGLLFVALIAILTLAIIYIVGLGSSDDEQPPVVDPSVLQSPSASPSATATQQSPGTSASPSTSATATQISKVSVTASGGSCYIEVFKGDLQAAAEFAGTLEQGQTEVFRASRPIYVRVGGDPAFLTLQVNGKKARTTADNSGTIYVVKKGRLTRE